MALPWSVICSTVIATLITTRKNQPASDFLERVAAPFCEKIEKVTAITYPRQLLKKSSLVILLLISRLRLGRNFIANRYLWRHTLAFRNVLSELPMNCSRRSRCYVRCNLAQTNEDRDLS